MSSPQCTSLMNVVSALCSIGPRQTTASVSSGSMKPMDITRMPSFSSGTTI